MEVMKKVDWVGIYGGFVDHLFECGGSSLRV